MPNNKEIKTYVFVQVAWTIGVCVVPLLVVWLTARAFLTFAVAAKRPKFAATLLVTSQLLVLSGWIMAGAHPRGETWWRRSALLQLGDEVVRSARVWIDPDAALDPLL